MLVNGLVKQTEINNFTYPLSLTHSSCLLLSLLGSPLESTATASSSSNDGARNKSRMFRCLLLLRARERDEPLLSADPATLPPWNSELFPPVEFWCWCVGGLDTARGGGRMIGNVFQWHRRCSATYNIIFNFILNLLVLQGILWAMSTTETVINTLWKPCLMFLDLSSYQM